ncbi:MAG: hypothetical protein J6I55_03755 [Ruminococcus sp.]|nr:hypothetical protein [Ruminococcus sp.]
MKEKLNENKKNPEKQNAGKEYSIARHYAMYFLGCFFQVISPVASVGIIWLFDIESSVLTAVIFIVPILSSVIFTFIAPRKLCYRKIKNKNGKQ